MVKPIVLEEAPISMVQMKSELESIKKKEKELNFRSNKTYEYLSQFTPLSKTKGEEMWKKMEGLKIPRLREPHMIKIMDLMPISLDELKGILQGYTLTINNENLKKILKVVDEYR